MKEIYIICNSEAALSEISSGRFPNLDQKNLFTLNNAYKFFRTSGRHLNFFTDTIDIVRHIEFPEKLTYEYEKKVEHIYSPFGMELANGNLIYRHIIYSPVKKGCSSTLGALAYLNANEKYDVIYLIGYTFDEKENPLWDEIKKNYKEIDIPGFYTYKIIKI